jgi:hypothetical protein
MHALALHPHLAVLQPLREELDDVGSSEVPRQGELRRRLAVRHELAIQNVAEQQRVVWERAERADSFTYAVDTEKALAIGADLIHALAPPNPIGHGVDLEVVQPRQVDR